MLPPWRQFLNFLDSSCLLLINSQKKNRMILIVFIRGYQNFCWLYISVIDWQDDVKTRARSHITYKWTVMMNDKKKRNRKDPPRFLVILFQMLKIINQTKSFLFLLCAPIRLSLPLAFWKISFTVLLVLISFLPSGLLSLVSEACD